MRVSVLLICTLAAAGALGVPYASAASVEPVFVAGNPTCKSLGYAEEFKLEPPASGTTNVPGVGDVTVTLQAGNTFDWTSTFGIDAVLAKGGPNANAYVYDPPDESLGDTGLSPPINPSTGEPFGISHISFCYDLELVVSKTAVPSFKRKWAWMIDKSADVLELLLAPGQTHIVNYEVLVATTGSTDSNFAVSGEITIFNPASIAAQILSVTDVVSPNIAMTVSCPGGLPATLPAGGTLICTYSGALPDNADRINTVTVDSKFVEGDSATAPVNFAGVMPSPEIDECVDVSDSFAGFLGTVCADEASITFEYSRQVGPYTTDQCEEEIIIYNKAQFVTNDTGTKGYDDVDIPVELACEEGCTLTQGYWKTHSAKGPAPFDDAWLNIGPLGANTPFFLSGKTWYQVFWTPPAGNVYYNLAHQYMAAKLNILNGASTTPAVDAAIAGAEAYFAAKTPSYVPTKAEKDQLLAWATTLDKYNNGLIGPGHCSE